MANEYKKLALDFLQVGEPEFKTMSINDKLTTIFRGQRRMIEFQCEEIKGCDSRLKNCRRSQVFSTVLGGLALIGVMWGKDALESISEVIGKILK